MAIHFPESELTARRARACAMMAEVGLDGLLIFRQESLYYLTGYDTFGYVFFQCLYLGADGAMTLLTRAPDLRQAGTPRSSRMCGSGWTFPTPTRRISFAISSTSTAAPGAAWVLNGRPMA